MPNEETARRILNYLHKSPAGVNELARGLDLPVDQVRTELTNLVDRTRVVKGGNNRYSLTLEGMAAVESRVLPGPEPQPGDAVEVLKFLMVLPSTSEAVAAHLGWPPRRVCVALSELSDDGEATRQADGTWRPELGTGGAPQGAPSRPGEESSGAVADGVSGDSPSPVLTPLGWKLSTWSTDRLGDLRDDVNAELARRRRAGRDEGVPVEIWNARITARPESRFLPSSRVQAVVPKKVTLPSADKVHELVGRVPKLVTWADLELFASDITTELRAIIPDFASDYPGWSAVGVFDGQLVIAREVK